MIEWKHDQLALDLAGYLSGPEIMVWTDMQLGPSGSPRPDVFTLRKSYSKPMPLAFECKISRSDLRSDTTSGKWQSYLKYAGAVTFAVPDGLCTVADIPDGCGLIVRKAKEWRYARRPTLQKVVPPFDACMKLLIDGVSRTYQTPMPVPRKAVHWQEHAEIRKRFGSAVAAAARDLIAVQNRIDNLRQEVDAEWERQRKQIDDRAQMLRSQYAAEEADWGAIRKELLDWLGIENGGTFAVRQRIEQLRRSCSADARVAEIERNLARARSAVEQALRHIPAPEPTSIGAVA